MKPYPEMSDIHVFQLPLPDFPYLKTANIYAVGKGPVTLIDTGPKMPGSLVALERYLRSVGCGFEDVERILLTHAHVDHAGLVNKIMAAAGHPIECFIHPDDKWRILKGNRQEQIWNDKARRFCMLMGFPPSAIESARKHFLSLEDLFDPLESVSILEDGDEFTGDGYRLIALHTPGHTSGGCCFYEPAKKILFSGDTVIKHITPIPLIEMRPDRPDNPNYRSLRAFQQTLRRLEGLDIRYVFSGHGEVVEDFQALAASYLRHHEGRMEQVWQALRDGAGQGYDILKIVFPKVPGGNCFLAMIEIVAHLESLMDGGRVRLVEDGPPAVYRAL